MDVVACEYGEKGLGRSFLGPEEALALHRAISPPLRESLVLLKSERKMGVIM